MFRDCCREGVPAVRQGKGGWEIYRAFSAGARSPAGVDRRGRGRFRSWLLGLGSSHEEECGYCPRSLSI